MCSSPAQYIGCRQLSGNWEVWTKVAPASKLPHCTLHTAQCTMHTAHCTLHSAHGTLHTAHCTLHCTVNIKLYRSRIALCCIYSLDIAPSPIYCSIYCNSPDIFTGTLQGIAAVLFDILLGEVSCNEALDVVHSTLVWKLRGGD